MGELRLSCWDTVDIYFFSSPVASCHWELVLEVTSPKKTRRAGGHIGLGSPQSSPLHYLAVGHFNLIVHGLWFSKYFYAGLWDPDRAPIAAVML